MLFYRSNDRCSIQVIGIVEQTLQTQKIEETISLVSKRTVFSMEDLKDILKKPTLIILFRLAKIIKAIPRDKFTIANINGNIQTIRKIEHSSYLKLVSNNE